MREKKSFEPPLTDQSGDRKGKQKLDVSTKLDNLAHVASSVLGSQEIEVLSKVIGKRGKFHREFSREKHHKVKERETRQQANESPNDSPSTDP